MVVVAVIGLTHELQAAIQAYIDPACMNQGCADSTTVTMLQALLRHFRDKANAPTLPMQQELRELLVQVSVVRGPQGPAALRDLGLTFSDRTLRRWKPAPLLSHGIHIPSLRNFLMMVFNYMTPISPFVTITSSLAIATVSVSADEQAIARGVSLSHAYGLFGLLDADGLRIANPQVVADHFVAGSIPTFADTVSLTNSLFVATVLLLDGQLSQPLYHQFTAAAFTAQTFNDAIIVPMLRQLRTCLQCLELGQECVPAICTECTEEEDTCDGCAAIGVTVWNEDFRRPCISCKTANEQCWKLDPVAIALDNLSSQLKWKQGCGPPRSRIIPLSDIGHLAKNVRVAVSWNWFRADDGYLCSNQCLYVQKHLLQEAYPLLLALSDINPQDRQSHAAFRRQCEAAGTFYSGFMVVRLYPPIIQMKLQAPTTSTLSNVLSLASDSFGWDFVVQGTDGRSLTGVRRIVRSETKVLVDLPLRAQSNLVLVGGDLFWVDANGINYIKVHLAMTKRRAPPILPFYRYSDSAEPRWRLLASSQGRLLAVRGVNDIWISVVEDNEEGGSPVSMAALDLEWDEHERVIAISASPFSDTIWILCEWTDDDDVIVSSLYRFKVLSGASSVAAESERLLGTQNSTGYITVCVEHAKDPEYIYLATEAVVYQLDLCRLEHCAAERALAQPPDLVDFICLPVGCTTETGQVFDLRGGRTIVGLAATFRTIVVATSDQLYIITRTAGLQTFYRTLDVIMKSAGYFGHQEASFDNFAAQLDEFQLWLSKLDTITGTAIASLSTDFSIGSRATVSRFQGPAGCVSDATRLAVDIAIKAIGLLLERLPVHADLITPRALQEDVSETVFSVVVSGTSHALTHEEACLKLSEAMYTWAVRNKDGGAFKINQERSVYAGLSYQPAKLSADAAEFKPSYTKKDECEQLVRPIDLRRRRQEVRDAFKYFEVGASKLRVRERFRAHVNQQSAYKHLRLRSVDDNHHGAIGASTQELGMEVVQEEVEDDAETEALVEGTNSVTDDLLQPDLTGCVVAVIAGKESLQTLIRSFEQAGLDDASLGSNCWYALVVSKRAEDDSLASDVQLQWFEAIDDDDAYELDQLERVCLSRVLGDVSDQVELTIEDDHKSGTMRILDDQSMHQTVRMLKKAAVTRHIHDRARRGGRTRTRAALSAVA